MILLIVFQSFENVEATLGLETSSGPQPALEGCDNPQTQEQTEPLKAEGADTAEGRAGWR